MIWFVLLGIVMAEVGNLLAWLFVRAAIDDAFKRLELREKTQIEERRNVNPFEGQRGGWRPDPDQDPTVQPPALPVARRRA